MRINRNNLLIVALNYLHYAIMLFYIVSPFFFSLYVVVSIYVIHQASILIFEGCIITQVQKQHGQLEGGDHLYEHVLTKITGKQATYIQGYYASKVVELGVLTFAAVKALWIDT